MALHTALSALFCLNSIFSFSQTKAKYDFEKDSAAWETDSTQLWKHTATKSASGAKSVSYSIAGNSILPDTKLLSINTEHTILKVRTANINNTPYIIASSYEGIVMGITYDGMIRWKNNLGHGIMNHDLWCADITGDGNDETLVASANGSLYCLSSEGNVLWEFTPGPTPMYAVCTIKKEHTPYVVCGGFDLNYYYLDAAGNRVKTIKSSSYSVEKPWSKFEAVLPPDYVHTTNFIRPVKKADGSQVLAVLGTNNQMNVKGTLYMFEPLADLPYKKDKVNTETVVGDFKAYDLDGDQADEFLLGTSAHTNQAGFSVHYQDRGEAHIYSFYKFETGYLVTQLEKIKAANSFQLLALSGNKMFVINPDLDLDKAQVLKQKYAYYDMCKDENERIILASCQSGGSSIHILDTQKEGWKTAYENLVPPGKTTHILANTENVIHNLESFSRPAWERKQQAIYLMTENLNTAKSRTAATNISKNYDSPLFLNGYYNPKVQSPESWNRDTMSNEKYRVKRDKRRDYILTEQEVLDNFQRQFDDTVGIATWFGHGNDPFFFSPQTERKLIDMAAKKPFVLIYPELEDHSDDFQYVLDNLLYPIAEYGQGKNVKIYLRTKHIFWQGAIYKPMWSKIVSGAYADIFVPSMEETTDKSMDLSVAGKVGFWASGAVNDWGTRAIMDNASFDRSRQHGFQRLPNHFLRHLIYHASYGARYLNNFAVDQDYMTLFWDLLAKGVIYVPKRNEIVSFSPVHLSMKEPDEHYINEGSNVKWTAFYNEEKEKEPYVFSRLNGTWPGAPVNDWDFSAYAAGVKDRRLNFLPPYKNGLVLITPPQKGVFADASAPRGLMADSLNPIYKNIMKEYITDGHNYFSADGTQEFSAEEYYKVIKADIEKGAKEIPVTVTGNNVAWVVAQTSPTHLRLTLIDGGYLNPDDRTATVTFNTVTPLAMKDLLDDTSFDVSKPSEVKVDIPCGMFRFIDIELSEALGK